ncbi:phosphonoacetate hydrolase [Afipia felis]|jgi:phosphonoacetate hydrolase|uniref:Phosphonoacetate hydrolase n=2 Tax=Afipia felis TaxID=1035 RepID=A0A380WC09_AFIFE|nr:phosphonoacetate hydrolase [Afipia felis]EKS29161.1 phosphonoacetate hydrolase [Afipia felis ATCC 53690]SUU77868.1 Phosphonoacetate hydrolase [Afipia felis]SUU85933.1 Phosphonoacetate hydrolase [Afipia felis]
MAIQDKTVEVNGRTYRTPRQPTAVICFDGCDPRYISHGLAAGLFPNISKVISQGFYTIADAAMPTFTNPNNMSIVAGAPPRVHGISGNYYLDKKTGKEVMITDASLVSSGTVLAALADAGVQVAAITAKDKLRKMLGSGLKGICFSSEKARDATLAENGIENVEQLVGRSTPDMYSPDLSLFVLDAGIKLLEQKKADLLYLSLSDMVQHSAGPGEALADQFNRDVDQRVGRLMELGAVVGIVADHGMTDKCMPDGQPQVVFLEKMLNEQFGAGTVRVICPITDPFVKHHGALGSFVRVYATGKTSPEVLMDAAARIPGVALVLDGKSASERYEMPIEREGDFIAIGDTYTAIGSRPDEHDLSGLNGHKLRSHGGLSEQPVPFMVSKPLNKKYQAIVEERRLRNFDIFDFALNGPA